MRLLLILLLLALPASAHPPDGDVLLEPDAYLNHTDVISGTLEAGATRNTTIAWEGATLQAGWSFLWSGTTDAPLEVALRHDGQQVGAWDWSGGTGTFVLPQSGFYELVLKNPGEKPASFALHFDQTCDCTAKLLQQPGALWFQLDADPRVPVDLRFAVVPNALPGTTGPRGNISGTFTVRALDEGLPWPEGTTVKTVPFVISPDVDQRIHIVDVPFTSMGGRHVVLLELEDDAPGWTYQVKPAWQLGEPVPTPGPGALVLVVLAFVLGRRA